LHGAFLAIHVWADCNIGLVDFAPDLKWFGAGGHHRHNGPPRRRSCPL